MLNSKVARRLRLLSDGGAFEHFGSGWPSAFLTGEVRIAGRPALVSAVDPEAESADPLRGVELFADLLEVALARRLPLVLLWDAGAHVASGRSPFSADPGDLLAGTRGVGRIYALQARLRGEVPTACALLGKVGASQSFPVALCDAAVMVEGSGMSVGRPDAVKEMTGHEVSYEELAGAAMHVGVSGSGDALVAGEEEAIGWVRRFFALLPARRGEAPPTAEPRPPSPWPTAPGGLIPADYRVAWDVRPLLGALADGGALLELRSGWGREAITALGRVEGRSVGFVASDPKHRGGILFPETCAKMARFVRFCSDFSVPLVFLADVPGFMVGPEVERGGIVRAGAELFSAIARAGVPKLCVVLRKAFTAGLYAMGGPGFDPSAFVALPGASIAIYGREAIERLAKGRKLSAEEKASLKEMEEEAGDPRVLLRKGLLDEVVEPEHLRDRIAAFVDGDEVMG